MYHSATVSLIKSLIYKLLTFVFVYCMFYMLFFLQNLIKFCIHIYKDFIGNYKVSRL